VTGVVTAFHLAEISLMHIQILGQSVLDEILLETASMNSTMKLQEHMSVAPERYLFYGQIKIIEDLLLF
jgi:hypothetical protein